MENRFYSVPDIHVNPDTCTACGLCSRVCPVKIFSFKEGAPPVTRHTDECVLCGQCLGICPAGAVIHSLFDTSRFRRIQNPDSVPPQAAFEFLSQRRSVRNYTSAVPRADVLEKIVKIAGYAPASPHHRVGWVRNITIVSGFSKMNTVRDITAEYVERMHKLLTGWLMRTAARFDDAARAGVSVAPSLNIALDEYRHGRDAITYNAPAAIFIHAPSSSSMPRTDCDAACLQIQLLAHAWGLGTCWNGLIQGAAAGDHVKGFTKLAEFLSIPKGHTCYAAMTIGYPELKLHSVPQRESDITWITD